MTDTQLYLAIGVPIFFNPSDSRSKPSTSKARATYYAPNCAASKKSWTPGSSTWKSA
jgi:hypothetical protein